MDEPSDHDDCLNMAWECCVVTTLSPLIVGIIFLAKSCPSRDKCFSTKNVFEGSVYYWNIEKNMCATDYGIMDCWNAQVYASSNFNVVPSNKTEYLIPSGCSYEYITGDVSYQSMMTNLEQNYPMGSHVRWKSDGYQNCTTGMSYNNFNFFAIGISLFLFGIFFVITMYLLCKHNYQSYSKRYSKSANRTEITPVDNC